MSTWAGLLDDYADALTRAEQALAAGEWEEAAEGWQEPAVPAAPPTDEDLRRFERLQERAATLEASMRQAMAAVTDELSTGDRKRTAARRYLEH